MSFERVVGYPSPEVMALARVDEMLEAVKSGALGAHFYHDSPEEWARRVSTFEEASCILGDYIALDANDFPCNPRVADQVRYVPYLYKGDPLTYRDIRAVFTRVLWKEGEEPDFWSFAIHEDGSITNEDIELIPDSSQPVPPDRKDEFLRHLQNGVWQ